MTTEEIRNTLGGLPKDGPVVRAIAAWLEKERDAERDAVCAPVHPGLAHPTESLWRSAGRFSRMEDLLHTWRNLAG